MTSTKPEADKSSAKAIGKKSGLLICSLNAPSLLKHKDKIEVLLNENRIDILAVNETKLDKSVLDSYITIENYSEPLRCDRNRHGGGVAVFVKESISYSVRTDLPIGDLEIVCIEVKPKCSSPFVILAWYRPPKYDTLSFTELEHVLKVLDSEGKEIILIVDTNCDQLCDETRNTMCRLLKTLYKEYQFKQIIKNSTRVTNRSSTLIDHFATNRPERVTNCGSLVVGFSDHDMMFGMRKMSGNLKKEPKIIRSRQLKHYKPESFREDLATADWKSLMNIEDVDLMSFEWERLFLKILDRHAPIRQRKVRNNYAPHINSDLRRKMFLRDYYKKKHRYTNSENDWQQYKKLRNAVNIENAKTKTDYFAQKLGEANSDIKETWKILNSASGKRSKTTTIHKLVVNDNDVSDPKQISDELNSYFCNIAESILKDSYNTSVSNAPFEPYILKIPKPDSLFKFKRVTPNDIVYHVAKLNTSRS